VVCGLQVGTRRHRRNSRIDVAQFVLARHARCNAQRTLMKHARDIAAHPPTGDAANQEWGSVVGLGIRTFSSARTKWPPFAPVIRYLRECSKATVCPQGNSVFAVRRIVESGPSRPSHVSARVKMAACRYAALAIQRCNATSNCSRQRACDIAYIHVCIHAHCVRANLLRSIRQKRAERRMRRAQSVNSATLSTNTATCLTNTAT
jgi:hypothetical protein